MIKVRINSQVKEFDEKKIYFKKIKVRHVS